MKNGICQPALLNSLLCAAITLAPVRAALACTRVLWNENALAVVVGRTMDWPGSTHPVLTVFPRGMQRDGGRLGPQAVIASNPARWKSRYGSVVTTIYGVGSADGINEQGLAMHMLYLTATDFGPRDDTKLGVQAGLWGQYLLDNAQSVDDALALMQAAQPVMVAVDGMKATVHLAIEDATGDSANIEYIAGKPMVRHGRQYQIMTNDPAFDDQLANLATSSN